MKTIARYAIFLLIGASIGAPSYFAFHDWQWWAWFLTLQASVHARDWAMR